MRHEKIHKPNGSIVRIVVPACKEARAARQSHASQTVATYYLRHQLTQESLRLCSAVCDQSTLQPITNHGWPAIQQIVHFICVAHDQYTVTMARVVEVETSVGAFAVELYTKHAPKTCENFAQLAKRGYYDGCPIHRIVPGFVIQAGDPTGTGRGGDSIYGKPFEDEISPELHHTGAGVLSMANAGPNTNKSQFFITLAPTPHLDGKHTIFGRVSRGMKTVEALSRVPTAGDDRPREAVKIISAKLVE